MATIILIVHLMLALALIATVLLQRSEGGALGIGGGGDGFLSGRGAGSALTRATAIIATLFIITSLTLGILATRQSGGSGILDRIVPPTATGDEVVPEVPAPLGMDSPAKTPAAAPEPAEPGVPRAQ